MSWVLRNTRVCSDMPDKQSGRFCGCVSGFFQTTATKRQPFKCKKRSIAWFVSQCLCFFLFYQLNASEALVINVQTSFPKKESCRRLHLKLELCVVWTKKPAWPFNFKAAKTKEGNANYKLSTCLMMLRIQSDIDWRLFFFNYLQATFPSQIFICCLATKLPVKNDG